MLPERQAQPPANPLRPAFFPSDKWRRQLRDSDVSPKAILFGLLYSTYADHKTGIAFPTIPTLQTFCLNDKDRPVNKSTICRWRAELVRAGFLRQTRKGDGRGHASEYQLTFPNAENGRTEAEQTVALPPAETVALPPLETVASNATPSALEVQALSTLVEREKSPPLKGSEMQFGESPAELSSSLPTSTYVLPGRDSQGEYTVTVDREREQAMAEYLGTRYEREGRYPDLPFATWTTEDFRKQLAAGCPPW